MTQQSLSRAKPIKPVENDRAAIEAVIGEEFHFTSPRDNRINRETYFEKCWKNSETNGRD
jgi:hypothetical protein